MCKRKKYNDAIWLLLASLDRVTKEKDELTEKVIRVQMCMNKSRLLSVLRKRNFSLTIIWLKLPKLNYQIIG